MHTTNYRVVCLSSLNRLVLAAAVLVFVSAASARAAFNATLQGQSFGSTNWSAGNVTGWAELDLIPMRVFMTGGPATARTITVRFDHTKTKGGRIIQGIQNLYSFTPSPNVVITSGPTLDAPPGQDVWSYTFTINLTNSAPGFVEFRARLAAGAHYFTGSSLNLGGSPSLGNVAIQKPAAAPGAPDLAIVKIGATNANPGQTIAYSISYQNKLAGSAATGVQIVDTLPTQVTFVSCTGGCEALGNTVTWDLGDLARGASGVVTYQVKVTNVVTTGFSFRNDAAIASAENDANLADNFSCVTTVVTSNCIPPSIVASPVDAAACEGDSVTFSVLANGSPTLLYQWRKNGVNIGGATNSSLTLNALTLADSGSYDVVVSNLCGSATSVAASLVVGSAVISSDPESTAACVGDSAAFLVEADGDSLTYQWRKDSVAVAGATNNLYEIASVTEADAGAYDVIVHSTCGSVTSAVATLTVNIPAAITAGPDSAEVCEGDALNLTVSATGSAPISYQWRKDGADLLGATNSTFSIASVATGDAGDYDVIVTGICGPPVTSAVATVTVDIAPAISQDPAGATVCAGEPVTLSVSATGSGLTYQWRKDGADLVGATNSTYSTASASAGDAGSYDVVVTGICGSPVTSAAAVVTVKSAPVAVGDSYETDEDTALVVSAPGVLANDSDADGDSLSAGLVAGPSHGSLTLNADGSFTYTPDANFNGSDSFTYRAQDDCGYSAAATVSISVRAVNDPPVAEADSYGTDEDTQLVVPAPGVLANDSDIDGDTLSAVLVSGPAHGALTLNANGSFSYTPAADYHGPDSFTYKANDGTADSASVTVSIVVGAVNDPPTAADDSLTIAEDSGAHAINVLANDSDIDGDTLSITSVTQGANGTVVITGGGTGLSYTPNVNFNGEDSFTYTISDGNGGTDTATVTVTVTPVDDAPVAVDDSYQVAEDDTLIVAAPGVLANDSDPEGSPLTAGLVSGPGHGSLTLNANGSFTYTPQDNYNGPDSFTYKANDGALDSNTATVRINVLPISGAGDIDLYVRTAKAKRDRAAALRDSLSLRGQINPRGMKDNLSGATIAVQINGVLVMPPQTLDARGMADSTVGSMRVKCRLKNKNGAYSIKLSGADLSAALAMPNQTEQGQTLLTVRVTINGADLEVPEMTAVLESPYRTVADKSTALRFSFRKHRTISGAFNCNKTSASKSGHAETVSIRGAVIAEGGQPVIPTGDIVIRIGNAVITVPLASLSATGTGSASVWQYTGTAAPGLTRFVLSNAVRSFTLAVSSNDIGLPAAGPAAPTKHDLPLMIEVPTAGDTMFFESIVELKRPSGSSPRFKR